MNSVPEDEHGRVPNRETIESWKKSLGWVERADSLDAEISRKYEEEIIHKRIRMYEEHAQVGNTLIEKGREFIKDHPIDDMGDALKAIDLGVEIQRTSVGQAEYGLRILQMTDDQLERELRKHLGTPPTKEEDEFIDVEPEEKNDNTNLQQ